MLNWHGYTVQMRTMKVISGSDKQQHLVYSVICCVCGYQFLAACLFGSCTGHVDEPPRPPSGHRPRPVGPDAPPVDARSGHASRRGPSKARSLTLSATGASAPTSASISPFSAEECAAMLASPKTPLPGTAAGAV